MKFSDMDANLDSMDVKSITKTIFHISKIIVCSIFALAQLLIYGILVSVAMNKPIMPHIRVIFIICSGVVIISQILVLVYVYKQFRLVDKMLKEINNEVETDNIQSENN